MGPLLDFLKSIEVGVREGAKEQKLKYKHKDDQMGEKLLTN